MDWTDVHYRQLARLMSKRTWLWTEMVVDKAVLNTPQPDRFLWFPPEQRPIVLQLGGSDPETLAAAAVKVRAPPAARGRRLGPGPVAVAWATPGSATRQPDVNARAPAHTLPRSPPFPPPASKAAPYGYDEINLNCGCPSDRVAGAGCFGAALMLTPALVADCMAAMRSALDAAGYPHVPLSVKCRLGVDDADSYAQLQEFVRAVSETGGVRHFVVHARKCLLRGLSPAQNRSVPPLRHEWVWGLKRDFPHLHFSLNGGVQNGDEAAGALALDVPGVGPSGVSGVMVGRAAYNDPWGVLGDADVAVFGEAANPARSRRDVLERYLAYCDTMLGRWGTPGRSRGPRARAAAGPGCG
jgi:tRNA-dihydrouridine synthase A